MAANAVLRGLAGILFYWKLLLLIVVVLASTMIPRPFCRYLCPLGAFYSLFRRFAFFSMHLEETKCIGCKKCESDGGGSDKKYQQCGVYPLREMP